MKHLEDNFGRKFPYIRMSITEVCNFKCGYCLPNGYQVDKSDNRKFLNIDEIRRLAKGFSELGVQKIRLTGGEPTVRKYFFEIVKILKNETSIKKIVITTNGYHLDQKAKLLIDSGLDGINISIDSLDAERFRRISRVGKLEKVLAGIDAAREAGFDRIKLNSVIMRGYNEDEVIPLADYALSRDIDIAFIEEMPLGEASDHSREETTCSNEWVRGQIEQKYRLLDSAEKTAGPSRYVQVIGKKSRIGFISPVSHNFCEDCNRVRVTVEGRLLLCLGNEHSVDLREILRGENSSLDDLKEAIIKSMDLKPERHYFYDKDHAQPVRLMNMTGG